MIQYFHLKNQIYSSIRLPLLNKESRVVLLCMFCPTGRVAGQISRPQDKPPVTRDGEPGQQH